MTGVETRAQIDTETVRALMLINGGGAVTLLTFLPHLLADRSHEQLVHATLVGILILILGLVLAVIHNRLRRECSLIYEQADWRPLPGKIWGRQLKEPTKCAVSKWLMWLSVACFCLTGILISAVGLISL